MLTISKPLSSGQAQSYHRLEFTSEAQSYYKQGDSVKGEWQGNLAARFGLVGEVSPLEFSRLADGIHPQTGDQLVRHRAATEYKNPDGSTTKSVEHRAGWDATFSAPKSVSLTALVGGDERVRDAHRAAVTTALEELERYSQARIGGNNPAETTGKFIAAKFEHDTARPVGDTPLRSFIRMPLSSMSPTARTERHARFKREASSIPSSLRQPCISLS